MIFIMLITIYSLMIKSIEYYNQQNLLLLLISSSLLILIIWMVTEGIVSYMKSKSQNA